MTKFVSIIFIPLSAMFVLLCLFTVIENTHPSNDLFRNEVSGSVSNEAMARHRQEAMKRDMSRILRTALDQNQADFIDTKQRIERTLQIAFWSLNGGVSQSIEELTSWNGTFILAKLMVQDAWEDSAQAEARIAEILDERILENIIPALTEVELELAGLEERMAVSYTHMNTELASAAARLGVHDNRDVAQMLQVFMADIFSKHETVKTIATDTIVPATVAAVFIKQTTVTIIKAIKIVVERFLKTQMISIGVAAADGPSPVFDCISAAIEVVGIGWCIWELYSARNVLKPGLAVSIRDSLRNLHVELKDSAFAHAGRLLEQYRSAATGTVNSLIESFE